MSFGWVIEGSSSAVYPGRKQANIDIFDFKHLVNLYRSPNGGSIQPELGSRFQVRLVTISQVEKTECLRNVG